jgi:hypothetical protein
MLHCHINWHQVTECPSLPPTSLSFRFFLPPSRFMDLEEKMIPSEPSLSPTSPSLSLFLLVYIQSAGLMMVLQEQEEMPEEEEEEPICLYCHPGDYLTVGLSCAFVGLLFLGSIFFVCYRNWSKVEADDESADLGTALVAVESEGKDTC